MVPTLLALLGDRHAPALYSDGLSMFEAPADRYVVTTVGWEPSYAAIGKDLKVVMYAGLGTAAITDPEDRPIADAPADFRGVVKTPEVLSSILQRLRQDLAHIGRVSTVGELTASLAHELNQPLTAILAKLRRFDASSCPTGAISWRCAPSWRTSWRTTSARPR